MIIKNRVYQEQQFKDKMNQIISLMMGVRDLPFAPYRERDKTLADIQKYFPELRRMLLVMENMDKGSENV